MVVQDEDALTEEGTCNGGTGGGFLVDTPHWGCVITLVVGVSKGGGRPGRHQIHLDNVSRQFELSHVLVALPVVPGDVTI